MKPAETQPNEPAGGQPPAAGEAAAKAPTGAAAEQAAPPRRQLTEEVRKVIRQKVAADKIHDIFAKLEGRMRENAIEWKSYEAAKIQGNAEIKEPADLDFASLAKEYGVTAGDTGEITYWQAQDTEIGKSLLENSNERYVLAVFDNLSKRSEISKHSPILSRAGNEFFLSWKSKDIKETASKWDDPGVQKEVLEAWRLEQARKPALARAKKLAAEAGAGKTTLKEAFAGVSGIEVVAPPPFTWMIGGYSLNEQYRLNMDIKGLKMPGEKFMKTVFTLNEMGVGTALNEPQTIAYVIQVEKFEPSNELLWKRFLDDDYSRYADAGSSDMRAAVNALFNELSKEAGLKWNRKADHVEKEDASGP